MHFYYFSLFNESYFLITIVIALFKAVQPQLIRSVEYRPKESIKFVTTPQDSSLSLFEMKYSYATILIDFGRNQQQVIIIRNAISVRLKLYFQIHAPLLDMYKTLRNEFCFQIKIPADSKCIDISNQDTSTKWFNMNFSTRWSRNKSGLKMIIDLPTNIENDLSGFYYFKSSSPNSGTVLSNYLEIRDVLFWDKNIIFSSMKPINEIYKPDLSPSNIPQIFSCSDQLMPLNSENFHFWIPLQFTSLVKWAWCPVSKQGQKLAEIQKSYIQDCLSNTISRCDKSQYLCPILSGKMPGWTEIISYQGSIALTSGSSFNNFGDLLDGYALMCYFQSKNNYKAFKYIANSYDGREREFTKGLNWNSAINERFDITLISSINQTIYVGILKKGFILTAYYHAPSRYTYDWMRFGKKVLDTDEWIVRPYSLECKSTVTYNMKGTYNLKIKSFSENIEFRFTLVILTPPILIKISPTPILSTVYLMVNSNFSIKYSFEGNPTFANIYINGLLYKPTISDRRIFLNDLANKAFNLKHLDFYFVENKLPGDITEYTYTVRNVLFPETLLRGQDHNLIIEVGNEYGVSRSLLNIYVLKPPKFESLPQYDNCTTLCSSLQPHLFRCELNSDYFTVREVLVEKYWLVNDIRLDSLPYHNLYFKNDVKGLNLMPLSSNFSESDIAVKVLLKKAKLICRVRLLYPGSLNMSDAKMIHENRIIYDTLYDPMLLNHFSAEIRIDWEPEIASASYTWIIFLAIALLLIVMFIFLLVKFTLRGQGKSYQIEKLELAKGYNRDEEIIENETIKPYLRSANNTTFRSNCSDK